ncbi:hypothetical protein NEOLI_000757 [Neolecta irregularis DAH-3]|uniref:Uncharacterized protein n=1 Tax=Neolecta irregularis (strain DAH-3) TaxID=1198029 RepID=A0A1U7LIT1_NEOID|nr:hypothetical protein NEOLI_000757 [Neolecta irregularis DAH-3]|eukprot:OLL22554.1 hypothetical protein NEOLI_000757 [Neolecta irregularis DAH-3]
MDAPHKEPRRRERMSMTPVSMFEGLPTPPKYYSTPATPGVLTPPLSRKPSVFFNPTHESAVENQWFYRSAAKVASEGMEERGESWIIQAEDDSGTVYHSESDGPKKKHWIEKKDGRWGKFVGNILAWWEDDDNDVLDEFAYDSAQIGSPEKRQEDGDWTAVIEPFSVAAFMIVASTRLGKWFL